MEDQNTPMASTDEQISEEQLEQTAGGKGIEKPSADSFSGESDDDSPDGSRSKNLFFKFKKKKFFHHHY